LINLRFPTTNDRKIAGVILLQTELVQPLSKLNAARSPELPHSKRFLGGDMKKIACAVLALCLIACGKSEETKTSEPPTQQNASKELEFAFNADQFVHAFNAASKTFGQSFRIHQVEVKHGAVHDYFEHKFSNNISLTAGVSKETGHVLTVTALVAGNGESSDDNQSLLAIAEVIAATVDPQLSKAKASALAADMLKEAQSNQEAGKFPQRFINHVRYVLRHDSGIGYWWIANPV
jgi:hypothetical protein